jgi:SAM-dependent methyltransferase
MPPSARYDEVADFYDGFVGDDVADSVAACLFQLAGEISGLRVLDLACGQGRVARELARRGASVTGVDLSTELLAKARTAEESDQLGIQYVHVDASSSDALAGETFDLVVSHFGLSDIDDLDGVIATVSRGLRAGGAFVFSIVHPCLPGWGDDTPSSWPPGGGYHAEGWWLASNSGLRSKVGANHRKLSTYLNTLVEHGLEVEHVAEPEPAGEWARPKPGPAPPVFLALRCRKR